MCLWMDGIKAIHPPKLRLGDNKCNYLPYKNALKQKILTNSMH